MTGAGPELQRRLVELARAPVLLVATDYDGTLAPIVDDPERAYPEREAVVAVRNLAKLANTHMAVVSGRALRDLDGLLEPPSSVHLVGSHGSEFDLDFAERLTPEQLERREGLLSALRDIASRRSGLQLEEKPGSVALHYRRASPEDAKAALREVEEGPARLDGVGVRHGRQVVELTVFETNKGRALETLRARLGATAVVFLGDDRTDEDAFATLRGPDLGIKVGDEPPETVAPFRVGDTTDVAHVLATLYELRLDWTSGGTTFPIERHSILSDQRTAALVTPNGRVTWLCVPRLDSSALFAEILGGPGAGYFSVSAADGAAPLEQRYREHSLVLETRWDGFTVTDFLDASLGRHRSRAGRSDLIRIVEGTGRVALEFAPRLDFGRVPTSLRVHENGLVVEGSAEPVVLRSPRVTWEIVNEGRHQTARAVLELDGGRAVLDLRYGTGSLDDTTRDGPSRRDLNDAYWSSWALPLRLPPLRPELVERSALLLRALFHAPTGALAAAATTSLPEDVGGSRNWDYRFCWPRDAALAAASLVRLGSTEEAMEFLDWMLGVLDTCPSPGSLQPLYGLAGDPVPAEAEIAELPGYRGSKPVRVANSAARQIQLDVFGPVVDLVWTLLGSEAPLSSAHWRVVEAMVQAVSERWHEPDHGIWEERLPPRHHVHSKVMCWVTVDRALAVSRRFLEQDRPEWRLLREEIAEDVLRRGWKPSVGALTGTYENDDLDAATLLAGLYGLLAPDDPRFLGTVEAVERELREGPVVYRYRFDDGLPGTEGGFHLCTAWLVQAYQLVGREADARELFDGMVALVGPTGLFSEQYSPKTRRALGNIPQAYSHVGVIESALRLSRALPGSPHDDRESVATTG